LSFKSIRPRPVKASETINDGKFFAARLVIGRQINAQISYVFVAERIAFQNAAFVPHDSDSSLLLRFFSHNIDFRREKRKASSFKSFMAGEILNMNPNALSSTIEFLTAMITPALLISATGSMVLSTSTRLGRVIDRVRQLTCQLEDLITLNDKTKVPLYDKKLEMTFKLLDKVTSRSRILQKAMVAFITVWVFRPNERFNRHCRNFRNLPLVSDSHRTDWNFIFILRQYFNAPRSANGDRRDKFRDGLHLGFSQTGGARRYSKSFGQAGLEGRRKNKKCANFI
jgi:hypothetical protein